MIDRYTKFILTTIAGALLYLAAIFTPWSVASAQTPSPTPGVSSGPTEVVIVGYKGPYPMPVVVSGLVEVSASNPLRINGHVTTDRISDRADRVVVVGWEENSTRDKASRMEQFSDNDKDMGRALPVQQLPR